MIHRTTGLDADGVRHLVFMISGFPIGSTACARKNGVRREALDADYEAITCASCLVFEHAMVYRDK